MSLYCITDWQCYFVPKALCHFQMYRSNVDALSHAVSAEGLLPLAWQGLLVALGLIAISATFVPPLTAIALWPNDNIKSQCTGRAWLGTMNRRLEIVMITVSARALQTSQVSCENAAAPKTAKGWEIHICLLKQCSGDVIFLWEQLVYSVKEKEIFLILYYHLINIINYTILSLNFYIVFLQVLLKYAFQVSLPECTTSFQQDILHEHSHTYKSVVQYTFFFSYSPQSTQPCNVNCHAGDVYILQSWLRDQVDMSSVP